MRLNEKNPPRKFKVRDSIEISDCGTLELNHDEMVTLLTENGSEYDIVRKSWGYYATPSLNGRLKDSGLEAYLVKSPSGKFFVWAVENGKEKEFKKYLKSEKHQIILKLFDEKDLSKLLKNEKEKCICGSMDFESIHVYESPPEGEIRFKLNSTESYRRELLRCGVCGHFISECSMNISSIYNGEYVDANYKDIEGMRDTFERIVNLPYEESDNKKRVKAVTAFAAKHFPEGKKPSILDVGSGLCVFLYEIRKTGWKCTALDTDSRQAEHAETMVGVDALCESFDTLDERLKFDVISFNRVLEHVQNPIQFLAESKKHLNEGSFIHVELPDGECAIKEGPQREEFFIDHPHVFSFTSACILGKNAGFIIKNVERTRDPSGKYTIRMFLHL